MKSHRPLRFTCLGLILLISVVPLITKSVVAANSTNMIANPGFEDTGSSAWFTLSNLNNGTVTVPSSTRSHNGTYSAQLSAVNKTLRCPTTECKDSVRAEVGQNLPGNGPVVAYLARSNESFSAWWYVAPSSLTAYSLHFQLQFSDGSIIEYWYGRSDLSNSSATRNIAVFNLGPIPSIGTWFRMHRDLAVDARSVVRNPSFTRVISLWFGAFGGTYNSTPQGETAWLDDVALSFDIPPAVPIAAFDSNPTGGMAPLTIQFNASTSHESTGFSESIIVFMWNWGDGSSPENVSDPVTSHTFANGGTYTVTLTVIDAANLRSSPSSTTIRVQSVLEGFTLPIIVGGALGLLVGVLFIRKRRRSASERERPKPKIGRR